jgi:hypothetical protein
VTPDCWHPWQAHRGSFGTPSRGGCTQKVWYPFSQPSQISISASLSGESQTQQANFALGRWVRVLGWRSGWLCCLGCGGRGGA